MRRRRTSLDLSLVLVAAVVLMGVATIWKVHRASAQATDVCAAADARLAATGLGDRDHDGLSNCRERRLLGTNPRDWDTDDDEVADGEEVEDGTDPIDDDTDDDGLEDGEEEELGTDPEDADGDDDGMPDGEDPDPEDELDDELEGDIEAITCPTAEASGSLTILGITIALTAETEFDGLPCENLSVGSHVEVDVEGDAAGGFVAEEVESEDADDDGMPDDVDDDDDNDGIADDDDDDDDGDGVTDDDE